MKILIVEDDRVSALLLRRALEKLGHEASVAYTRESGWDLYQTDPAPIVIANWNLPDHAARTLCQDIRGRSGTFYSYILFVMEKGSREDRIAGLQAGADDFLLRPIDVSELAARLEVARRILCLQEQLQTRSVEMDELQTDLKQKTESLVDAMLYMNHSNRRFSELFEGLPAACCSWDQEGRIHEWNRAAATLFGYDTQEVFLRPLWDVLKDPNPQRQKASICAKEQIISQIFAGQSLFDLEVEERSKSGRRLRLICNILPMRMTDGNITGAISTYIDITERTALAQQSAQQLRVAKRLNARLEKQQRRLAEANARLSELAVTDGLTGMKNHRYFREQLENSLSLANRHQQSFSVILLDVDHFKQFNDTHGHPAGDEILRSVADLIQKNVRAHDIAARYGGEEFVVLCPATDAEGGRELAERLRQAISNHAWEKQQITASFGVATYPSSYPAKTGSDLIELADRALYYSKKMGRDCVMHCTDARAHSQLPISSAASVISISGRAA